MPMRNKNCNCRNSRCLKLYCECFASGLFCDRCNCVNCCNNLENAAVRQEAVEATLERNPNAFRPKIAPSPGGTEEEAEGAGRHNKGCHCKKSSCLKKYCECFQANIFCSDICRCIDCKNFEGSTARALTAAKAARQPPSSASPRKNLAGVGTATGQPLRGKLSGLVEGDDGSSLSALQSKIALVVARQPFLNQVVSKGDVDELSQTLLTVSEEAKRKCLEVRAERVAELSRIDEAAGGEAKKAKTEEELSPGTKALLCDEDVMPTEHASSLSDRNEDTNESQATRSLAARENSVLSELAKNIKKLAVRKKCQPCEIK